MDRQNGNALFLILIAVALFAALSYAVTQSGRGNANIEREQEDLIAAQIVSYASAVEQAINRLVLINGCTVRTLNFDNNSDTTDDYVNPQARPDGSCDVFSPEGGSMDFRQFPEGFGTAENYSFSNGYNKLKGTADHDLMMFVPMVSERVCKTINRSLGLPEDLPRDWIKGSHNAFKGYFTGSVNPIPGSGPFEPFRNEPQGCVDTLDDASRYPRSIGRNYFYYHVLLQSG